MLIHCIKETVKQEDFLENQEGEAGMANDWVS